MYKNKKNDKKLIMIMIFIIVIIPLYYLSAERTSNIRLIYADKLIGNNTDNNQSRFLIGNVHLQHNKLDLFSDRAEQFILENSAIFKGNILIQNQNTNYYSDTAYYYGNSKTAFSPNYLLINTSENIITADSGEYDFYSNIADLFGRVEVESDSVYLSAGHIKHYRVSQKSYANNNASILLYDMNLMIRADSMKYFPEQKYAIATATPILIKIDTILSENTIKLDTMTVSADVIEGKLKTNERTFFCRGYAEIMTSDISARANLITFYKDKDIIILEDKPIVWYGENQIHSDSIVVMMKNNKIERIDAFGNAIFMMKNDTIFTKRIDQLTAERIIISFKKGKINSVNCISKAKNLYFYKDEEGLIGADRTSTDSIKVYFEEGKLIKINWLGKSEKDFINGIAIAGNEKEYYLPKFKWFNNKPERHEIPFLCR